MKKTLIITAIALIALGAGCSKNGKSSKNSVTKTSQFQWMHTPNGWQANGTPPACPSPLLQAPTDIAKVTSILYPGQTRGNDYKAHGGFRFDGAKDNGVDVVAPMDGNLVRGSRYLVNGETQYTFDFINDCGVMYRLGHLLTLTSKFQVIANSFPAAVEGDSRTTDVVPSVSVSAGEKIATAVGVTKGGVNVFFDFGVYDLKVKNAASKNASYAKSHDAELAQHAICWFDALPSADAAKVKSLPAGDPKSGKTSDYCPAS